MNDIELINKELQGQLDGARVITEESIQEHIDANVSPNRTEEDIRKKFKIGDKMIFVLIRHKPDEVNKFGAMEAISMMYGDLEDFIKGVVHEPFTGEMREHHMPRFKVI